MCVTINLKALVWTLIHETVSHTLLLNSYQYCPFKNTVTHTKTSDHISSVQKEDTNVNILFALWVTGCDSFYMPWIAMQSETGRRSKFSLYFDTVFCKCGNSVSTSQRQLRLEATSHLCRALSLSRTPSLSVKADNFRTAEATSLRNNGFPGFHSFSEPLFQLERSASTTIAMGLSSNLACKAVLGYWMKEKPAGWNSSEMLFRSKQRSVLIYLIIRSPSAVNACLVLLQRTILSFDCSEAFESFSFPQATRKGPACLSNASGWLDRKSRVRILSSTYRVRTSVFLKKHHFYIELRPWPTPKQKYQIDILIATDDICKSDVNILWLVYDSLVSNRIVRSSTRYLRRTYRSLN